MAQDKKIEDLEPEISVVTNQSNSELSRIQEENKNLSIKLKQAEQEIAALNKKLSKNKMPTGNYAVFNGTTYEIIGDYRADNTFAEVKRGNCDEGITLLAIQKVH